MNQKIETKKIKGQRKLTNPCSLIKGQETTYFVGCKFCKSCRLYVKEFEKDGVKYIHCDHTKLIDYVLRKNNEGAN